MLSYSRKPTGKGRAMKNVYLFFVVFGCSSLCYSHDGITPEKALGSYENYLRSVRSISFHSEFRDRNAAKSNVFANGLSQKWKIDFEGRRLRMITQRVVENPKTGSDRARTSQYNESLITSGALQQISVNADGVTVHGFTSYLNSPKDYWKNHLGLLYLSYPFGYLQDGREYRHVPDLIRRASRKVVSQRGESCSLVVLTCETEEYALSIQLDPSKGWMADRLEFERTVSPKGDIRPDYCLYAVDRSSDHGGVWLPDLYHCKVSEPAGRQKLPENIRIVDGKIIIVPKGSRVGTDAIERPKATLIAEVTLSDVDLSPLHDSDFQLQTNIPNGTRVSMQDALHLEFVWRDGKIVPVTAETLEALRNSRFVGGPGSRRFWLVTNVVLLVALISCFVIRRWRKARARMVS
jgi:hypothetical protein